MNSVVPTVVFEDAGTPTPTRSGRTTLMVLLLLVAGAAAFSYIVAYAAPDALASANVLHTVNKDVRPRTLGITFAGTMVVVLLGAMVTRVISRRQLRRIDAMSEEE